MHTALSAAHSSAICAPRFILTSIDAVAARLRSRPRAFLRRAKVGGENGAPPSTESSDLGFLFCVCQRDDEPPGAGAPADLDDDDDDDDECGEAENPFDYPVQDEAAREGGAFGAVHEELVMGALVASRLAYSDANMTDALSDESLGPYAEGLDFVDKVPPSVPRSRRVSSLEGLCLFDDRKLLK